MEQANRYPREHQTARTPRRLVLSTLLLLAATLAFSCSSDGETLTLEEWAVAACDSRTALASLPAPTSLADFDAFEAVTDTIDEAISDLDAVEPPESINEFHDGLIELYQGISGAQRDFLEAATDGDASAVDAATAEYQAELERVFGAVDPDLLTSEIEQALQAEGCDN